VKFTVEKFPLVKINAENEADGLSAHLDKVLIMAIHSLQIGERIHLAENLGRVEQCWLLNWYNICHQPYHIRSLFLPVRI
jgi:hypothetical protein